MFRRLVFSLFAVSIFSLTSGTAGAHQPESCPRVVVVTVPGVTWATVERAQPRNILEAAEAGSIGSMSVRTNSSRTTYASGFASLGAGARVDGGGSTGHLVKDPEGAPRVAGLDEVDRLLDDAGYTTVEAGALAGALGGRPVAAVGTSDQGFDPPVPVGRSQWSLLAATDGEGVVDVPLTGPDLLRAAREPYGVETDLTRLQRAIDEVLAVPCMTVFVDTGDLARADALATATGRFDATDRDVALARADEIVGSVRAELHEHSDLLLILAPTSPAWEEDVHFGVAIAEGPRFPAGTLLQSPSTRRPGMVTLPDIAPTILSHFGEQRPSSMLGRSMYAVAAEEEDRVATQIGLDEESVFVDSMRAPISTAFVVVQVAIYAIVALFIWLRERRGTADAHTHRSRRYATGALGVVAFPVATYMAGIIDQTILGPIGLVAFLLALDALIVGAAMVSAKDPFDRLLVVTGFTYAVIIVDLMTGAQLQLNTVFSYSPLVAGRFAGIGNIAYSVLAAVTVLTGALIVHRAGGSRSSLRFVAFLFALAVFVDAAPGFGADVGGILALVPGLGLTWLLLADRKPNLKMILVLVFAVLAAGALFLALDLARPEESQTHLARLWQDTLRRGPQVFVDVVGRKLETNIRVFRTTIWTYLVPPALALIALLLVRPSDRWQRVADRYPRLRAGLVGCLCVAVLGFAFNDSGIVVPAMMLAFLAPLALFMHVFMEEEAA